MAGTPPADLKRGTGGAARGAVAQDDRETVGEAEGEPQAPQAFGDADFELQPAQAEVGFEIAEGLLDLHPLAIEADDGRGRQERLAVGGHEQGPRLLVRRVVVHDHVDQDLGPGLIRDVAIAHRAAGRRAEVAEFHAAPLPRHARPRPAAQDIEAVLLGARPQEGGALIPAIAAAPPPSPGPAQPAAESSESPLTLWYRQPAAQWVEALPVGNGRLGAMVFGGVEHERLQLNEDTLWAGGPYDPSHADGREALPRVRCLIANGNFAEAERLIMEQVIARPPRVCWLTAGRCWPTARNCASSPRSRQRC